MKIRNGEWILLNGIFSNEEGGIEAVLCDYFERDYEDADIIFKKEEGY